MKVSKLGLAPQGTGLSFPLFSYFGSSGLAVTHFFNGLDLPSTRAPYMYEPALPSTRIPKIQDIPEPSSILCSSFTIVQPFYNITICPIYSSASDQPLITIKR